MASDKPRPPLPNLTPLPVSTERRIVRLALELVEDTRPDLTPEQQRNLASAVAYRVRSFKRVNPHS